MKSRIALLTMLLVLTSRCIPAWAEDWPQFRGPTGQGHSTEQGLPVEWNAEKNIAWRAEINGEGWSSPVVVEEKVFLTTAVEENDESGKAFSLRALCLSAKTGELIWAKEIFWEDADAPKIHDKNSHATPTPLAVDGKLYVHFAHLGTACLDYHGNLLWQNRELDYTPVHGGGCSPILVEGMLVFSADGSREPVVVALDAQTGALRWKFARPNDPPKKFAFCTPLAIEVEGRWQIISPGAGSVSALNPSDGSEIWRVDYGQGYSVVPRPIYAHGLIYLSSGFDSPEILAIRPDGTGNVTETHVAWRQKKGAPLTPSMVVVGDELYCISDRGVATCFDAKTGETHWTERIGGGFSSSLLAAEGKIYFQSEEGPGTVIASNKTFQKLAENGFSERTLASYAAADKALFIRTTKALYRVQNKE